MKVHDKLGILLFDVSSYFFLPPELFKEFGTFAILKLKICCEFQSCFLIGFIT